MYYDVKNQIGIVKYIQFYHVYMLQRHLLYLFSCTWILAPNICIWSIVSSSTFLAYPKNPVDLRARSPLETRLGPMIFGIRTAAAVAVVLTWRAPPAEASCKRSWVPWISLAVIARVYCVWRPAWSVTNINNETVIC